MFPFLSLVKASKCDFTRKKTKTSGHLWFDDQTQIFSK